MSEDETWINFDVKNPIYSMTIIKIQLNTLITRRHIDKKEHKVFVTEEAIDSGFFELRQVKMIKKYPEFYNIRFIISIKNDEII